MAEGLAALNRKLTRSIPDKVYNSVRDTLSSQADNIVAAMKRLVPVDSGDLSASIKWCWGNAPKGTMTLGSVGRKPLRQGKDTTGLRISIYAGGGDEWYAWLVEFGTAKMTAQPFFYPSFRAYKRRAKGAITRAVNKGVKAGAA